MGQITGNLLIGYGYMINKRFFNTSFYKFRLFHYSNDSTRSVIGLFEKFVMLSTRAIE